MSATEGAKVAVLTKIRDNKETLFGKFSSKLHRGDKDKAWKLIHEEATALGINIDRQWTYMRDTTWQNWRKRAMEKRTEKNGTGKKGGKYMQYTDADHLVFDILGEDSAVLDGLPITESTGTTENAEVRDVETDTPIRTPTPPATSTSEETQPRLPRKRKGSEGDDEEAALKKRKLELQNTALELDNRKKSLEIMKMEEELGLPRSKFIADFLGEHYEYH